MRRALVAAAIGVALAASGRERAAQAEPPGSHAPAAAGNVEIVAIHATRDAGKGTVDPRIAGMLAPNLQKKPFSDFNSFAVLGTKTIALEKGKAVSYELVTGRTLRVTLRDVTPDKRYAIDAAIDQPGKPEYLKLLEVVAAPNEPFFVGGQSYKGGTLILAITVRP